MPPKKKSFSIILENPQPKKSVIRYDIDGPGIVTNIYASKPEIEELGNPDRIKVTVEAA